MLMSLTHETLIIPISQDVRACITRRTPRFMGLEDY